MWQLLRGVYEVVPKDLLSVFDYQELQLLMSGLPSKRGRLARKCGRERRVYDARFL